MKVLGVITARGGSEGIPHKNTKLLCGKPLIAYTIEAARRSEVFDRIILSTDDPEIAAVAKQYGCEVPFLRPAELADNKISHLPVMQHAVQWLKNNQNYWADYTMILQPTSPLRQPFHIREAVDLIQQHNADSVLSVSEIPEQYSPYKAMTIQAESDLKLFNGNPLHKRIARRQDLPKAYWSIAMIYLFKTDLLFHPEEPNFYGEKTIPQIIDNKYVADINVPQDWEIAERAMRYIISSTKENIVNTIGNNYADEAKQILNNLGNVEYIDDNRENLIQRIKDSTILLTGLKHQIDKKFFDSAPNLKIVATPTTGLDHIDVEYAKSRGVEVISLRGENDFLNTVTGTAELTFGLIIDLLRNTHSAAEAVRSYEWKREQFRGHVLFGKTLGIVGLGRIGKMVAKYGRAFGMVIVFYDPYIANISEESYIRANSLEELMKVSDIISIHTHLTSETENMINKKLLDGIKNSAYIINTARANIVNEADLLEALKIKKVAGYGTDVLNNELSFSQQFSKHPLVEYAKENKNVIILPHIGGMTLESRKATDIFISEKIKNFIQEKDI